MKKALSKSFHRAQFAQLIHLVTLVALCVTSFTPRTPPNQVSCSPETRCSQVGVAGFLRCALESSGRRRLLHILGNLYGYVYKPPKAGVPPSSNPRFPRPRGLPPRLTASASRRDHSQYTVRNLMWAMEECRSRYSRNQELLGYIEVCCRGFLYLGHNSPGQEALRTAQAQQDQHRPTIPTTIAKELQINLFLRASSVEELQALRASKDAYKS